ncbi:unnamed protein product [Effrenium voratum]|uniref:Uncharacterized protein n=1 Tax=Effrenium voratum TaxID=2562239 RepID=A0AA36N280_9DINO|nr:unnamed protein product [Effrenium voratum]CAJ1414935.1 unnamed protein product [Effrenium voratum]
MFRVACSPEFDLNGMQAGVRHARSNLAAASMEIGEPFAKPYRELSEWQRRAEDAWRMANFKAGDLPIYHLDQLSDSLRQELRTFMDVFAIRLESREAALADAARSLVKSSEAAVADLHKRFEAYLEKEGQRLAERACEKAVAEKCGRWQEELQAQRRMMQDLSGDLKMRFLEVESQLQNRLTEIARPRGVEPDRAPPSPERFSSQLQGLSKECKSLEQRLQQVFSRLATCEKSCQQALAQEAVHQQLARQQRELSQSLTALAGKSVSPERVAALEAQLRILEWKLDAKTVRKGKDLWPRTGGEKPARREPATYITGRRLPTYDLPEGLHVFDLAWGSAERAKADSSPERRLASTAAGSPAGESPWS